MLIYAHMPLVSLLFFFSKQAKALLQTASSLAPHMYEPHFNFATISDKVSSFFLSLPSDLFVFFFCVCVFFLGFKNCTDK